MASGPMHIARAVGTPTFSLFLVQHLLPNLISVTPVGRTTTVVLAMPLLRAKGKSKRHFKCMNDIQPYDIITAFESLPKERSLPVLFVP